MLYGLVIYLVGVVSGWWGGMQPAGVTIQPGAVAPGVCGIEDATLKISARDKYNGTQYSNSAINSEVFDSNHNPVVTQTVLDAFPDPVATDVVSTLNGYVMLGNDNSVTTDRGDDYYFTKKTFSYSCVGSYDIPTIDVVLEYVPASGMWTGYDRLSGEEIWFV